MNKNNITNVRNNLNRAKQERNNREIIKGDLLVMCATLAAVIAFIVII